jgi:hypothetical protein
MKRWVRITVAIMAAQAGLAFVGVRLSGQCPLARHLAAVAPSSPARTSPPVPAAPVAERPAPAPRAGPPPSTPHPRLDEKQFIELSSTILMEVAQVQDRPDAKELIPPLMAAVLEKAGVSEEEFEATAQGIYADPARSRRVGDAILDRVEQRSTPQMRMRVADLAEAMKQRQGATQAPPPTRERPGGNSQ